jgi:hypothetical protein
MSASYNLLFGVKKRATNPEIALVHSVSRFLNARNGDLVIRIGRIIGNVSPQPLPYFFNRY